MPTHVSELVQQTKPEVVETVVPQCQADNRSTVCELKGSSVKMGTRKMLEADEMDTMFG
jgi:hypothetical protein